MFAFDTIVLTRFPFTDLSGEKPRSAMAVSQYDAKRMDLVACLITSIPRTSSTIAPLSASAATGLKVSSVVRADKLATLNQAVIAGKLGHAPAGCLRKKRDFAAFSDLVRRRKQWCRDAHAAR